MQSLSIGRQFFLTCGMAMALTLSISVVSLRSLTSLGASMQSLIEIDARKQFLAGEIDVALTEFLADERGIIRRAAMQDKASVEKYTWTSRKARCASGNGWMKCRPSSARRRSGSCSRSCAPLPGGSFRITPNS